MLNKFVRLLGGDPNRRKVDKYAELVTQINAREESYEALTDEQISAKTAEFKARLAQGETLEDILPEAFALVREASKRTLGLRHYDVQMVGGIALHRGEAAEMRTGEGKTLVATLPLYLNALTGRGVHLVTVNDYLARRDARWMAPIYTLLGLKVGVLQMAARTENGKKAFLVDLERESPHEDQHHLHMAPRHEAYAADVTYGTNSEFGFDYLRDNMTMRLEERVQQGHYYVIVDEVDNVLIDEARTPLIISGPAQEDAENYVRMAQVVRQLRPEDYEVNEKDRNTALTEIGETRVEELLGVPLRDPDRPEDITLEQARLMGYLEQAMRAQFLFRRNKDYLVQAGKVVIVDEFTGRLMPGRRWSDGLHQAVEAKEGVRVQAENVTYATITIQNYFRMYEKLAGMSGTAITEAEEFHKIYQLEVVAIPTNLEYQAARPESGLVELDGRDELGYKYKFYGRKEDAAKKPVFWKRKDYPDVVYRTEEVKFRAIAREILRFHVIGRPVLVGTTSVELSDRLSARLRAEPLRRLTQVLLLRDVWFERNQREEDGRAVAELQPLNQPLDALQPAEMRKMARELEISSNPQDAENLARLTRILDVPQGSQERLLAALQGGIPHQVLNARKHTEESQIIAGAGAFGAVTIATNMAGRGVDIRLGGEIPEDVINQVRLLLRRQDIAARLAQNGLPEIDELPQRQWPAALALVEPSELGARAEAVERFRQYLAAEEQVRQLGGLHVIGSERHEARRIDNQLRGRSARQGDPGSSRFYLSMEDELMRLFGGQQVDSVMQRLHIDDAMPLEVGVVGRLVEQSQTRVEGANFDVRKHLLEYDDVLNAQRQRIYDQRDRIFTKTDLSEDVTEMLRTEVLQRVPEALADSEGPWKLLAWLDQVQPSLSFNGSLFPSYSLRLVLETLQSRQPVYNDPQEVQQALLGLAADALRAEREHLWRSVAALLDTTRDRLEDQVNERMELLDTFIQGLELEDEESGAVRQPREIFDELSATLHLPLKLTSEQQRQMRSDPAEVLDDLRPEIENMLRQQTVIRLLGAVERRLEEALELNADQLVELDWDLLEQQIFTALENQWERRSERLLGNGDRGNGRELGQIGRDLDTALTKMDSQLKGNDLLGLLMLMPQGARATFDKRTHRRVWQRTTRLVYIYLAARQLDGREPEEIAEDVLRHLEKAQQAIRASLGARLWPRAADALWSELDERTQESLSALLGEAKCRALENYPLSSLDEPDIRQATDELGRRALTEIYRSLLLGVITELWVEYLTQMEALRVSIGLEAYAQRDPLVQYKTKASELFQTLFTNVRLGVVSRMFTYQPRELPGLALRRTEPEAIEAGETEWSPETTEEEFALESGTDAQEEVSLSRRRRRRRR